MCNRYCDGLVMPFPDTEVLFNYKDQKGQPLSIDLRLVGLYAIDIPLKLLSVDFDRLFKQAFHIESSLNDCQSPIKRNESYKDAIYKRHFLPPHTCTKLSNGTVLLWNTTSTVTPFNAVTLQWKANKIESEKKQKFIYRM